MTQQSKNILLHLAGSLLFLSVPVLNSPDFRDNGRLAFGTEQQKEMLQFVLLLGFFYLNYFLLIPRFVFRKKFFVYGLLVVAAMLIIAYLPSLIGGAGIPGPMPEGPPAFGPGGPQPPRGSFFLARINHNVFLFLAVVCFSLLLQLRERWQETQKEKLNAELLYLKAQMNPHFLYNTLNSIYALALQKADNTAEAVQQLSSLMRYVLTESANDLVPLKNEIGHIGDYIKLQQLRFGSDIRLLFNVKGDAEGKKISPLILITFIENAFKYGVNAEEASEIIIEIDISEKTLSMFVRNKMVSTGMNDENNTKLGLINTKDRLELLYPGAYSLSISELDQYYSVTLTIEL